MVGLFINTLPIRARIDPQTRLLAWLRELRAQGVALRDYEHTPLAQVQNWSALGGGQPLFESLLVFENYALNSRMKTQGRAWANREIHIYEQTNYPLTVKAYDGVELCLQLDFDRRRFEAAAIQRMLGHLQTLLAGMAAQPRSADRRAAAVDCRGAPPIARRRGIKRRLTPAGKCVHELFEPRWSGAPRPWRGELGGQQLTYRELNSRGNQLAHVLAGAGGRSRSAGGGLLQRSAGNDDRPAGNSQGRRRYCALGSDLPPGRMAYMLEDAGTRILLTQEHLLPRLPQNELRVICLDSQWEPNRPDGRLNPPCVATPENLAYVIYTSGSTGQPKGVMIPHRGLVNYLEWCLRHIPWPMAVARRCILQFRSI